MGLIKNCYLEVQRIKTSLGMMVFTFVSITDFPFAPLLLLAGFANRPVSHQTQNASALFFLSLFLHFFPTADEQMPKVFAVSFRGNFYLGGLEVIAFLIFTGAGIFLDSATPRTLKDFELFL
jgi:hypothetical protein